MQLRGYLNGHSEDAGKQLRGFSDLWISSGIHPDGVEEPKSRILPEFAREHIRCSTDNPVSIYITPDGAVKFQAFHFFRQDQKSSILDRQAQKGLDAYYGIYLFLLFLASGDLRFHLAKCLRKECAAPYFFRERLHSVYKNGAVCPHHRKQAASRRAREDERKSLLQLAAKYWPQWAPVKHPNRSLWIAEKMNERRKGMERRITQKWVSRNIDVWTGQVKCNAKG